MNVVLWVLQILLALHTLMGAVWKLSSSEQTVPALSAIPHPVWLGLSGLEMLCVVALVAPAFKKSLRRLAVVAAGVIAAEMLLYCAVDLLSGAVDVSGIIYWLVVTAFCGVLGYGRLVQEQEQG